MIHKYEFWLGADSNPVVYKLALLEELIRISWFYDSKVNHWFHSYFEGIVYAYWENLIFEEWLIVNLDKMDQMLRMKIFLLVKVIWKDRSYEEGT